MVTGALFIAGVLAILLGFAVFFLSKAFGKSGSNCSKWDDDY